MSAQHPNPSSPEVQPPGRWSSVIICCLLALAVWVVFNQTLHYDFVNYDDPFFVYQNPAITQGLTWHGVVWLFTHPNGPSEWLPLTAISHMLDWQCYGTNAGGHHLTNILLHAANVILLFLVLRKMTGALWRSAFAAAVFAIHPLRVESVAWVTERKDVLSGLFFMLTLWAYVGHARKQGAWNSDPGTAGRRFFSFLGSAWYWLALALFTLGLLSKTMLVTLPFVLLLLDYWPLRRMAHDASAPGLDLRPFGRLFLEKVPFLLLSAAACVVTVLVQKQAVLTTVTFPWRIGNALVAYAAYLWQTVYPAGLAVLYPHPGDHLPVWQIGLSVLVLLIFSAGVLAGWRKHPYLLVGWLWYLGMLVPVIGLIQVGYQSRADRYTYLPQIGLSILLTWGVVELCSSWRQRRAVLGSAAGVILAGLLAGACVQAGYWKDSISLWNHTLACTSDNFFAHNNLGLALAAQGDLDGAIPQYEQTLQLKPDYVDAHIALGNALAAEGEFDEAIQHYDRALQLKPDLVEVNLNIGSALVRQGKLDEAIQHYEQLLQRKPDFAEAHMALGGALATQGKWDEAVQHFERAVQLKPGDAGARDNLGLALATQGKLDQAIENYRQALQLDPNRPEIFFHLGMALSQSGRFREAVTQYREALRLNPDLTGALNNLAWALAASPDDTVRNGTEAIQLAEHACDLTQYRQPVFIGTLAAAYAEAGRFSEAVATAEKAEQLATRAKLTAVAAKNRQLLELYRAGKPYHEPAPAGQK